ncbi:MAG: peptidase MA family metallohydrolase [Gemmatimonadaceae bacterium]
MYFPQDERLARSLVTGAARTDSFPWLPRPGERVLIAIAPDARRFRQWAGPGAPEWGVALAFPQSRRVIIQGRAAGSEAGDPLETLRHELAHLALHERLGDRPPRWFDEGYASVAAREWRRDDVLATNVALALRGTPTFDQLESSFNEGATAAQSAYALSYRAVAEMASLDPERGLTLLFRYWESGKSLDAAVRQAFGITLSGFEREFQTRVRRRYGALALFADLTLVFLVTGLALLPFFVARRARDRRRLRDMLAADAAAERAERESIMAILLGPDAAPPAPAETSENVAPEPSAERPRRRDDEP